MSQALSLVGIMCQAQSSINIIIYLAENHIGIFNRPGLSGVMENRRVKFEDQTLYQGQVSPRGQSLQRNYCSSTFHFLY